MLPGMSFITLNPKPSPKMYFKSRFLQKLLLHTQGPPHSPYISYCLNQSFDTYPSFIPHSLTKYILSTYYVSDTVLQVVSQTSIFLQPKNNNKNSYVALSVYRCCFTYIRLFNPQTKLWVWHGNYPSFTDGKSRNRDV